MCRLVPLFFEFRMKSKFMIYLFLSGGMVLGWKYDTVWTTFGESDVFWLSMRPYWFVATVLLGMLAVISDVLQLFWEPSVYAGRACLLC